MTDLETALAPMRLRSVPEAVSRQLREAILSGELQPGQRLLEQKLAARFAIGQPTLREALRDLEHQGFVRRIANRGTYVIELSEQNMADLLEVRMRLETLAIAKAAPRITEKIVRALREQLDGMRVAAERLDLSSFHQCDMAFHCIIWELSGNEHLASSLERTASYLFAYVLLRQEDRTGLYAQSVHQHEQILEGLASRDATTAVRKFEECTLSYWSTHRHLSPR